MKKLGQKLLSLALTCALVITMMPMAGLEAFGANEVLAANEALSMAMTFDGGDFNARWEEAYKYSDDHDGALVSIVLRTDAVTTESLDLQENQKIKLDLNGHTLRRNLSSADSDGEVFYLWDNAELTIEDSSDAKTGKISGGNSTGYGGGFYVEENAKLTLNGITVADNASEDGGGAFYIQDSAQVTLNNVTVSNNTSKGHGGAFYIEDDAQLKLDGVKVTDNSCTQNGAAIYAIDDTVVTIKNSIIGGARHRWDEATDRYYDDGNISALAFGETGGAIYVDYDASLYINNTTITGNEARYGEVGAIFWSGDGRCELIDVDIFKNEALDCCGGVYADSDGTDIYIGGRVYIHDNEDRDGARVNGAISSNLHLEDDAANINRIADRPLTAGSKIGITFDDIDDDENDCITASDSKFEKADLSYFYYDASDKNGIVLRKVDQGTDAGNNRWALYATKPNKSENEIPEITGAAVNTAYATSTNAVIDNTATDTKNRSVTLTVKKDIATKRFVRYAALRDFASFGFFESDTKILETAVVHDFVSSPTKTYTVMTPNGTFEYWDIKVVPEGRVWDDDPYVAEVNGTPYASFDAAWADALNTPGSTLKLHADWLAGDMNNNGVFDPAETAGKFAGSLGTYKNGALYVNQKKLTVDLNGHKIDRMGGTDSVFYVQGSELTIKDSSATATSNGVGVITGSKGNGNGGAFYVSGSKLFIYGGTITGNTANHGGAIYAVSDSTVEIYGGTITGNSAESEGGAIYLMFSWLRIYGGEITQNEATYGGAISPSLGAKAYIYGGEINGNSAEQGGAIYVNYSDDVYILDPTVDGVKVPTNRTIRGNFAEYGGAIYVQDGKLTIEDSVTIRANSASEQGGGIYVYGDDFDSLLADRGIVIMDSASIEANIAKQGGGVYVQGGTFTMTGGEIRDNSVSGGGAGAGVCVNGGTFTADGGSISKNTTSGNGGGVAIIGSANFNLNGATITNNKGAMGGGVYWNGSGNVVLLSGSITGNTSGFWAENSGSGKISVGGTIKITGNAQKNLFLANKNIDLHHYTSTPLASGAEIGVSLDPGEYGLDNEDRITAEDGGFREKDYPYFFSDDPSYRLANRENVGAAEANRWHLHLAKIGTAADERPVIIKEGTALKSLYQSNLSTYVDEARKTVIFYVDSSKSGNKTAMQNISLAELADFAFATNGTKIIDIDNGKTDNKYDFVETRSRQFVLRTPNGTYDYWTIGVAPSGTWGQDPLVASVTYKENGATTRIDFTAGNPTDENPNKGFAAAWELALKKPGSTLALYTDWLGGDANSNGVIDTTETAGNFSYSQNTIGGALYMNNADADVTIDLNGHKIDRGLTGSYSSGSVFTIYNGKLTLISSYHGAIVTGGNHITGGGAFYVSGGNSILTINGVDISGNTATRGGAIYAVNHAKVYLQNGNISNNTATSDGGAVYIDGANLYMSGGSIANNSAVYKGGAVCMLSGTVEVTGGSIANNSASNHDGGGLYLTGGTFNFNGGDIRSNTARNGGGVYAVGNVKFNFNGGNINGNTASAGNGGGVYVAAEAKFNFNDGYINDNKAINGNGGGVYVTESAVIISRGGYVQNNTASAGLGGGIYIGQQTENVAASILENTLVSGNSAKRGGGIAFHETENRNVVNTIRNMIVHGNTATERGGGIEVDIYKNQHVNITGSKILENRAPNGAGIYYANGFLNLTDSSITDNIATTAGAGVFINGSDGEDINLSGSIVIRNNRIGEGESTSLSNLYLDDDSNDINISNLSEGSYIGVSVGHTLNWDQISKDDSAFRADDGRYFHADNSATHNIAMTDSGSNDSNRYKLYLVKTAVESDSLPGITGATAKIDSFKPSNGSFAQINEATRTLTLTVNNTHKHIFENFAFNDFVTITTSDDSLFADNTALSTKQNFVTNPSKVYQIIEENDTGADGYDGWYTLWTIEVVPEGGAWSDEIGHVARVTYRGETDYYYDMEMAYLDALKYSVMSGGATLTLNQDWTPVNVADGFKYAKGTDDGCLYLNDSNINLTVDLNGFKISRGLSSGTAKTYGQAFFIEAGSLTIRDSSEAQTGMITGCHTTSGYFGGGAIYVGNSGRLTLNGGSIAYNYTSYYGGAIYLEDNAKFIMNGGSISYNTAGGDDDEGFGGGVYMQDNAAFTMNGGEIYWNKSEGGNGGGIYMRDSAAFIMSGGTIVKNHAYSGNGGGIYASDAGDGVTVTMNGGEISDNYSENNGSGIYWLSDGNGKLYLNGGTITRNSAGGVGCGVYADDDGSDPYVGGTIRIVDNMDADAGGRTIQSNMYLEDDGSNLRQNPDNPLREGAMIGVSLGYDDENDYFSASDSRFAADSVSFFSADDPDYIVRMSVSGSGTNSYRLYMTLADDSAAANSQAAILGASVKAAYATTFAPVFQNNVASIPVDPDAYLAMRSGDLCLNDVLDSLTFSADARIDDASVLNTKADLTAGVNVKVRAADGNTIMTWLVKVVPGNESGVWNSYSVTLKDAAFAAENAKNSYYPGETVSVKPLAAKANIFKRWTTVDLHNALSTDEQTGVTSFVMPKNNVEITAEYFTRVESVAVTLDGTVAPKAEFPASGTYIANSTLQGVGNVSVVWKKAGVAQSGTFGFNTQYTAEVTIDLSAQADYLFAAQLSSATVNGYTASVLRIAEKAVTLSLNYTMPKAKILEKTTSYTAYSKDVPGSMADFTQDVGNTILAELRNNHKSIPVVTEDSAITTVFVNWQQAKVYKNDNENAPYVEVNGLVQKRDNPDLDFSEYAVTARVYGTLIVSDPVISIETDPQNVERVIIAISCDTTGATIKYTTDGTDPLTSESAWTYSGTIGKVTSKGDKTTITVKAVAIKDDCIDSNVVTVSKTFDMPYNLTVNGENVDGYTVTGNSALYRGKTAVVTVTPKPGYWVSSIDAGTHGNVTNTNSITIKNPTADVEISVSVLPLIEVIDLGTLSLIPGQAFPSALSISGNGYTAELSSWNTNDSKVAYGTTYTPSFTVKSTGSSYPFASGFAVKLNGETVYTSQSSTMQHSFSKSFSTEKAKLNSVTKPGNITMNQGEVLTLPQVVNVTTEGGLISSASVTWTCTDWTGFNANAAGVYNFSGTLVLPANVDANNLGTFEITVTVNALPQMPAPSASDHTQDVKKTVNGVTSTVRATIVNLSSSTVGATIYYTINGDAPVFGEGYTPVMEDGKIVAYKNGVDTNDEDIIVAYVYDPGTGIVLDTSGNYTIKAVAYKENYITSDVASFSYTVNAPSVYTIKVYNWVNGRNILAETRTATEGETVSFAIDSSIGLFAAWDVEDNKWQMENGQLKLDPNGDLIPDNTWEEATFGSTGEGLLNSTLRFTMPASNIDVTGVYVARINTVNISGIDAPVAYKPLDTLATSTANVTIQSGSGAATTPVNTNVAVAWTDGGNPASGTAEYGKAYTGTIVLTSDVYNNIAYAQSVNVTGLSGARNVKATVNGEIVTITFEMVAAPAKMSSDYAVGTGNVLTVANGTLEDAVKAQLPQQLTLSTEAGMIPVNVTWSCVNYNSAEAGEYIFTADLSDAVLAANGIDRNGKTVSAKVTVKVEKPEVTFVAIPTVDVAAGSYAENKTVQLSCVTEDAVIYYTVATNGTPADPKTSGTLYDGAISVEGAPGQTVSVVIMAVAKVDDVWSDVATYRYTINIPAPTYDVTVENGTISGGASEFKAGEAVTIVAEAPAAGYYFTGWHNGTEIVSTNSTYTFTMPANAVSFTATYAEQKVTRVDIRVTEPVAGSELSATLSYDLTYNVGAASRNNSMDASWKAGSASASGTAVRGNAYTLSVVLDEIFASDSPTITLNGQSIGSWDSQTKTFAYTWPVLKASYRSHVKPAPIVGIAADTAFRSIELPATVAVAAADGTTTDIAVDWTLPGGSIGSNATVTISGKLNPDALAEANITGGTNEVVTIYVSSVARQQVAAPTAVPSGGTYVDSVAVKLSCTTNNAVIYYTLDGSTPTTSSIRYSGDINLTQTTTVKAIAVRSGMENSEVAEFTYVIEPTYELSVTKGEGSGKYKEGVQVTVKAESDLDNYFTHWTVSGVTLTEAELKAETVTFTMPAGKVSFTANYAPKVNLVEVAIGDLEVGEPLPVIDASCIQTSGVSFVSGGWVARDNVKYSTVYTANITISAEHGFAEHGDVKVNGEVVPSVMNSDGTVTLTYQVLSGADRYESHTPTSVEPVRDVPYGTDLSTLVGNELPANASITTASGDVYTVAIKWDYSAYDKDSTAAQTVTVTGEIVLPTGVEGTNPTITAEISVLAKPAFTLTVIGGSGSGKYMDGAAVTVIASEQKDKYFTGWSNGTEVVSTSSTYSFTMPAEDLTLTAVYEDKVNVVEITIGDLVIGKTLPTIDASCVSTSGVSFVSGGWTVSGNVEPSTTYIANIILEAEHGFAEHGDVRVNGNVVTSVMNNDGTITVTYQILSSADSYAGHTPETLAPIVDVPYGTDLSTLGLPATATVTTTAGKTYTAGIKWDFSAYDQSITAAQTVTVTGTIILPAGITGTNPTITVDISILAKPAPPATYTLTVNGGSGSGEYLEGAAVTVIASEQKDKYFIGWSNGTSIVSTDATYSFRMPAEAMTLTATYGDKVKFVDITIGDLVIGKELPAITVTTSGVSYVSGGWTVNGNVEPSTTYIASFIIQAEHGFAEHGDVRVNGNVVSSAMNNDGTVTVTYQVLSSADSYASHTPETLAPIVDVPYGTELSTLSLPATATVTTTAGKTYTAGIKWDFSAYDQSIITAQTVTVTGTIILPAGITGTNPTITVDISILAKPTYTLTVNGGSGSGEYLEGAAVTITANDQKDKYFIGWSNGTSIVSTDATYSFRMPAEAMTLTATYGDKVKFVDITIGDLVIGQSLPSIDASCVSTFGVSFVSGGWTVSGNVEPSTAYTANIILEAEHGFAEHGDVRVNGNVVTSVMNNDGTITVTYQVLSSADSYAGHTPETLAPIVDVPYGTDLSTLELPATATVTTTAGKTYTAGIKWDFSAYDQSITAAQTVTVTGTIILPAGITGTNPTITVDISILAKPTYILTVIGGSGSGEYLEGAAVTVIASEQKDKYFIGWSNGTSIVSTDATYSFRMLAEEMTLTATYGDKVKFVDITIGDLVIGKELPAITVTTSGVSYVSGGWTVSGNVEPSTAYTANIILEAEHGFAEHGDVRVNGNVVTSVMNNDGTITVTYQVLSSADSYAGHTPETLAPIVDVPYGTDLSTLSLPATATVTTTAGKTYTAGIKWDFSAYDQSITAAQTVTVTGTIILPAGITGTNPTITVDISILAKPAPPATYTLTVNGGSGSGEYLEGAAVTITANEQKDKYFIGWSNGTSIVSTDATYSFRMPAEAMTLTATYGDKVKFVDITIGDLVIGKELPAITVTTSGVSYVSGGWTVSGNVEPSTAYTANIILEAEHGFAEHGDVRVNGNVVTSVMNNDGTITVTYQVLSSADSYASHTPETLAPIVDVPYGTELSTLGLPATATVTTTAGKTYTAGIKWDFSAYDQSITAAQTVTVTGTIILPAGITGTNPTITVDISILAKPAAPATYALVVINGSGSGSYAEGSIVTVTAGEVANKYFTGWTVSGVTLSEEELKSASVTFTMPAGDVEFTANYAVDSFAGYEVEDIDPIDPLPNGADLTSLVGSLLPDAATVTTISGKTYTAAIQWSFNGYDLNSSAAQTVTAVGEIILPAGIPGTNPTITVDISILAKPTYTLTVNSGSGSGEYQEGAVVTITASEQKDKIFTGWTVSGITLSEEDLNSASVTFRMPAGSVEFTANYADKVKDVELTIGSLVFGQPLPAIDGSCVKTPGVSYVSGGWSVSGNVEPSTAYTATITLKAENGFAAQGTIKINGKTVSAVMNNDGTVTITYQVLSSADSYVSHAPETLTPVTDIPNGTDLSTLVGSKIPAAVKITTFSGKEYSATILWNFSAYDQSITTAQTVTVTGEIILPAGITGTNPTITVDISILAKPAAPSGGGGEYVTPSKPVVPDAPCDGGEDCISHSFADVDAKAWYHEAVDYVVEKGMMNGVGKDKFNPNGTTTRAMIVTILWRLEGSPVVNYAMDFQDVSADQWYTEAIRWAASEKIVEGWNGKFGADDAITREQFATILYRYEQYKDGGFAGNWNESLNYADKAEVSDWAKEAMCWMNMNKVINGKTGNILDPKGSAIRAEAAAMLQRYCELETK